MHNILVTGADGQLGREMRTLGAGFAAPLFFTDVADLDITDANAVRRFVENERIDAIVNCAAYTNVDKAEEEAETADRINHEAVRNLAEAAKACGATLFHISTDYVFGGMGNIPFREEDPTAPLGVYGKTARRRRGDRGFGMQTPGFPHRLALFALRQKFPENHVAGSRPTNRNYRSFSIRWELRPASPTWPA